MLCRDRLIDCLLIVFLYGGFKKIGVIEIHICFLLEESVGLLKVVASLVNVLLNERESSLDKQFNTME
jgi:hypothetical protein